LSPLVNADAMPTAPRPLADLIAGRFGVSPASLDLAPVGYALLRSGDCSIPGVGAVHAIYAATAPGRTDAVSLWVIGHDPAWASEPGRVYTAIDAEHPHPMLFWTDGRLDYYLVGEHLDAIRRVPAIVSGDPAGTDRTAFERRPDPLRLAIDR
jgi:hypothetical protein